MKDIVDHATLRSIAVNADGATAEFYARLRARKFESTRCNACGHVPFPPRMFCPKCGHDSVTWVPLPEEGTLYAFSQQQRSLRFMAPDVLGLVQLDAVGLVFTRIDAPFDSLRIDQKVVLDFFEVCPTLTVHQFRPA